MVRFFSWFFGDAKCFCYLLTLRDEIHLASIENSVVNNKRESNEKNDSTVSRFSFQLSLAFVCTITVVSIHEVNPIMEWIPKEQYDSWFIFLFLPFSTLHQLAVEKSRLLIKITKNNTLVRFFFSIIYAIGIVVLNKKSDYYLCFLDGLR